jgi:uncharacterized protein (TIGR00288 family)
MNSRQPRSPTRAQSALIHRGPQAMSASSFAQAPIPPIHAPNAALLIDFDNVTMGIRSDLGKELRSLLSSEIIRGKVAVQRAYADWRRYPMYIVPLSEASIDLIFAPAYGSSKKNATDIRLAIDALELVFTRPEIGTFILLSGDSDFSSLVIKLKEYGKYVIGVGIRESSSDLLVQNCDEYYSYNALAGLVKANEDEPARKYDPWELVTEALQRMKRANDVMRSDRLKQVMQEIDASFDEKNLGISKFSRFCQEAAQKGLLSVTKLDNGQLEVDLPESAPSPAPRVVAAEAAPSAAPAEIGAPAQPSAAEERPNGRRRGRRGGRGRDREGREREPRAAMSTTGEAPIPTPPDSAPVVTPPPARPATSEMQLELGAEPKVAGESKTASEPSAGAGGDRLTRAEAFDLLRRTVADLVRDDESVRASAVRARARQLLGRDSESLSDRMFVRILKDAHDGGIIDLRRRGNDFEVARATESGSVADQLAKHEGAAIAKAQPVAPPPGPRLGMGPRGSGARHRLGAPPPELLAVGVVDEPAPAAVAAQVQEETNGGPPEAQGKRSRGSRVATKTAAKKSATKTARPRAKKSRPSSADE